MQIVDQFAAARKMLRREGIEDFQLIFDQYGLHIVLADGMIAEINKPAP